MTVVGARPQFIKAGPVSRALREGGHEEFLVHTGQHYDYGMSQVFFDELDVPRPHVNLGVASDSHGRQTGQMMARIDGVLHAEGPDWVLVYGDTNSTMAGALVAAKMRIPVAHVEAGLRSFNRDMPEEINRLVTDHVSTLLCCPTQRAVDQLAAEGIEEGVALTGDVMLDAFEYDRSLAWRKPSVLQGLGLSAGEYGLLTLHRPANTDDRKMFALRMAQVAAVNAAVVWPTHPRSVPALKVQGGPPSNVRLIEPVGRLEMIRLLEGASALITDSGGLQKEAFWAKVPCFTLREETEWEETVESGWNSLVGSAPEALRDAMDGWQRPAEWPPLYGDGRAGEAVVDGLITVGASSRAGSRKVPA